MEGRFQLHGISLRVTLKLSEQHAQLSCMNICLKDNFKKIICLKEKRLLKRERDI